MLVNTYTDGKVQGYFVHVSEKEALEIISNLAYQLLGSGHYNEVLLQDGGYFAIQVRAKPKAETEAGREVAALDAMEKELRNLMKTNREALP